MNAPVIYHVHPQTAELLGHGLADPDPLSLGGWLVPYGATLIPAPEVGERQVAVFQGQAWKIREDWRRETIYRTDDASPCTYHDIGPLPAEFTTIKPGPNQVWENGQWVDDRNSLLERLYQEKSTEVSAKCLSAITGGFWSPALGRPHQYGSELDDQLNLTGAILAGQDSLFPCRDKQGVKAFRSHSFVQLRQVSDDFNNFKMQLLQQANHLKQQLEQALTTSDLKAMKAITWAPPA